MKSPYELRHKDGPFVGHRIPFGVAIHFRPNKALAEILPRFGPNGVRGIFVGLQELLTDNIPSRKHEDVKGRV